jgi:hypothetical protein
VPREDPTQQQNPPSAEAASAEAAGTPRLKRLATAEGVARLRALGDGGRGFLGLDPRTQNDALVARVLTEREAVLFVHGETLLGAYQSKDNPRQAVVAVSGADPAGLAALARLLRVYRRYTSMVAVTGPGDPALPALRACRFREVGTLAGHDYRSGAYRDAVVHYAPVE